MPTSSLSFFSFRVFTFALQTFARSPINASMNRDFAEITSKNDARAILTIRIAYIVYILYIRQMCMRCLDSLFSQTIIVRSVLIVKLLSVRGQIDALRQFYVLKLPLRNKVTYKRCRYIGEILLGKSYSFIRSRYLDA